MSDSRLTVIIRHHCPYCEMALDLLDERNLVYKLLILNVDFTREEFTNLVPGAKTYPQILFDGKSIGGFEELTSEIDNLVKFLNK